MNEKINLAEKFALLDEPYHPATIGYVNDAKLVVGLLEGEFVWHKHDDTDDFFLVIEGELTIQLRDRDVVLGPGELFVVPRGVEHCPKAAVATHVLLIEKAGTPNTGDTGGELTRAEREALEAMDVHALISSYNDAWNAQDLDAIAALHAPDIVFHNHTAGERAEGAEAVREHIAAIFRNNPDLAFSTRSLRCGDDFAVCEWTAQAGGREWDGVDVFPLRDGLILRKDVYSSSHRAREIDARP